MSKIHSWLKYYRASLIDGTRGGNQTIISPLIQREKTFIERFSVEEMEVLWSKEKEFSISHKDKELEVKINKIEIAPVYFASDIEHGSSIGNTKTHYPFWIPASVTELGELLPPKEGEVPLFIRNYLEPNPRDLPTIATIEDLDKELGKVKIRTDSWRQYWEDCEVFFKSVTDKKYINFQPKEVRYFAICRSEDNNVTRNILQLYNDLIFDKEAKNNKYKVLEKILEEKTEEKNHKLKNQDVFLNENHFGQMSNKFPLSESQRRAFGEFTSKLNTDVFAINGPPGTGKTTILQSVIANSLVGSVIAKEDMPLLIGCSTNNQAITNILDSMDLGESNDVLSQRWLPNVNSFGLYLASSGKSKDEASQKYQLTTSSFLNTDFVKSLDDKSKIEKYRSFFSEKYVSCFSDDNLEEDTQLGNFELKIKTHLFKKITEIKNKIDTGIGVARGIVENHYLLKKLNFKNRQSLIFEIESIQSQIITNANYIEKLKTTQKNLTENYILLPFYIKYIPFKKFKIIKQNSFKLVLQAVISDIDKSIPLYEYHTINADINRVILEKILRSEKLEEEERKFKSYLNTFNNRVREYNEFFNEWDKKYSKKWDELVEDTGKEYTDVNAIVKAAAKLDISYRYELFWLSVHYREWQKIEELTNCDSDTSKERGQNPYKTKLKRLAKVTPLFISTFHSLPKFSTYYKYPEGNRFYNGLFDLMIIDESGQVSPEVAMPSLSLTKKVLAVGDIFQIEPVWNVTKAVDYMNAKKYEIISNEKDFENISTLGLATSNGSLMKIIRKSTPFSYTHKNGEKEKGAYLLEHRRCLDPIITYSSKYIYKGSLNFKGGKNHKKKHSLPPLGYIHVNGSSEKHQGSSRKNIKEANAIVAWVVNHKEEIEKAYDKSLDKSLAIITPFSAQKNNIKNLLKIHLDSVVVNNLIVGTVHALQGAERPIILFSAVHDTEDKMLFFDYHGKYNMLNVAITRAKHSFIVFGNMGVFNAMSNSPSGNLAKILFSKDEYALNDTFIYKSPITYPPNQVKRIDTLEEHRDTLIKSFKNAQKELIIFSPFISIKAIEEDNIIELISEVTKRGVKVTILTDECLDKVKGSLKNNSELGRKEIKKTKAVLKIVNGIHNKTICIDNSVIIEGSFNWLSATRDVNSPYFRHEASVVLQSKEIKKEILKIKKLFLIGNLKNDTILLE